MNLFVRICDFLAKFAPGKTLSASVNVPLESFYSRPKEEQQVRQRIVERAHNLLGIPYQYGAKDADLKIETRPASLDCSGAMTLAYSQESYFTRPKGRTGLPDGAQNQYVFCHKVIRPEPGDLGFMRYWSIAQQKQVWHVGLFTGNGTVINASNSRHEVVEDPLAKFVSHDGFLGWGRHPEFIQEA